MNHLTPENYMCIGTAVAILLFSVAMIIRFLWKEVFLPSNQEHWDDAEEVRKMNKARWDNLNQ